MDKPHWSVYVFLALAVVGLLWQATAAWFGLQQRVTLLEREEQYNHGDVSRYLPK